MKNSESVNSIFSESPRKLYRLSAVVFLVVILLATLYLILVKYDTYYDCDFLVSSENTIIPEFVNKKIGHNREVSLMLKDDLLKNNEDILIASTKLSEEYSKYFSTSIGKEVVVYFEKGRRNQYTDGVFAKIIEIKDGLIFLQITKILDDEPLFKGKIFLNYPVSGRIQIKRIPFIKSIFS